jgi:hypothetical protein
MIMTRHTPCFKVNNYLHSLTVVIDDIIDTKTIVEKFLQNMKPVASIHENV